VSEGGETYRDLRWIPHSAVLPEAAEVPVALYRRRRPRSHSTTLASIQSTLNWCGTISRIDYQAPDCCRSESRPFRLVDPYGIFTRPTNEHTYGPEEGLRLASVSVLERRRWLMWRWEARRVDRWRESRGTAEMEHVEDPRTEDEAVGSRRCRLAESYCVGAIKVLQSS